MVDPVHRQSRFIPAPAGNTTQMPTRRGKNAVHPRACGEHPFIRSTPDPIIGSSPRLRGTRWSGPPWCFQHRFIPAPAGNTVPGRHDCTTTTVHPRACGEHGSGMSATAPNPGSSPRLRGTLSASGSVIPIGRFIPAPAGNTQRHQTVRRRQAVHPRACGEHHSGSQPGMSVCGSSPRLRGTQQAAIGVKCGLRFIPAPAGNTGWGSGRSQPRAVHPRACGEHAVRLAAALAALGSSPRLRGTHDEGLIVDRCGRFIPAPAGNTARCASPTRAITVHPRACGEHT